MPRAPIQPSVAESTQEKALSQPPLGNDQSFQEKGEFEAPPGRALVSEHLDKGFGQLFFSRTEAERFLGSSISTAPLGCISRQKEGGGSTGL